MTGFVALDVFIGLAFIFLLYSLLATVIVELIASAIGLRAQVLKWTIARMLTDTQANPNLVERILFFLAGIFGWILVYIQTLTIRSGKGLLSTFYNQPQIKFLSEGGSHNKPSYMHPQVFSLGLVEALKDVGCKAVDQTAKGRITEALKATSIGNETRKQLNTYWEQSWGDIVKFRSLLEDWFDQMNERATGWYKRKVQGLLLLIGLGLAIGFRVDAIEIGKRLSVDDDLRKQSVQLAIAYMERNNSEGNGFDSTLYKQLQDSLSSDLQKANSIYGLGWNNADLRCRLCTMWNSNYTLGYWITAFAISLGAPFWFDMLNKLVKLRSSVPQSTSDQQGESRPSGSSARRTDSDVVPASKRVG